MGKIAPILSSSEMDASRRCFAELRISLESEDVLNQFDRIQFAKSSECSFVEPSDLLLKN